MSFLPGMFPAPGALASGLPPFSYRNTYTDNANQTTYTFNSVDFGLPHARRLIVVGAHGFNSGREVSSMTIGGLAATPIISSGLAGRVADLWCALVPAGTSGTVSVTFNGSCACAAVNVWAGYPASVTPVDAVGINGTSTTQTLSNLAKTAGGFACLIGSSNSSSDSLSFSGNGAESVTTDFNGTLDSSSVGAASFVVTATTTADDYTATYTAGGGPGRAFVGATWV